MDIEISKGQHRIIEARHVLGFLNRLHREQIPLDICAIDTAGAGEGLRWSGLIRELDYHRGEVLIIPLDPAPYPGTRMIPAGTYRIYGELSGVGVHFQTHLESPQRLLDYEAWSCRYPRELYYHQRRQSPRTPLTGGSIIPVSLHLTGYVTLRGRIEDLSGSGLRACFYRFIPISNGELVPACHLHLPGNQLVRAPLQIKGISQDDGHRRLILRGRFQSMNRENRRLLADFLARQQN